MVNQQLVDYIRSEELQGYGAKQLHDYLVQQGYDPAQVMEAISSVNQVPLQQKAENNVALSEHKLHRSSNKSALIASVATLGVILVVMFFLWFSSRAVCGDGVLDEGETSATCCLDAGCPGERTCVDNECIAPVCGECQYVKDDICVDHDCCSDEDCTGKQRCENNLCIAIECGDCGYADKGVCKKYACCANSECDDGDDSTVDICKNPTSLQAMCSHLSEIELGDSEIEVTVSKEVPVEFKSDGESHKISVEQVAENAATIVVISEPQRMAITVGEMKEVDFGNDGLTDIEITLLSIKNETLLIKLKKISYGCVSDAECDDGNTKTTDECLNPATPSAYCNNYITPIDCGEKWECFISYSTECYPAKLQVHRSLNYSSMTSESTVLLGMRGIQDDKCRYYEKLKSVSVTLREEELERMLNESFSQGQIDQQIETADRSAQAKVGVELNCLFYIEDLTAMLIRWQNGTFTPEDLPADCSEDASGANLEGECMSDLDCDDGNAMTKDVCMNRGTSASYCAVK